MSQPYSRKDVLRIVRSHWSIENGLHWPLDVTLDEDLARNRKDNGPANLAVLRRLALNVARAHLHRSPCVVSSSAPDGTMPSSSNFSATCDSPASDGDVQTLE